MGTTIGRAIDYLVSVSLSGFTGTDIYGKPLTVPALSGVRSDVIVADTRPDDMGEALVVVGRASDQVESEVTASAQYQVLGRQRISESYTVPVHILVTGAGPDYKSVRDDALALFDGFTKLVWADPTLGGVLENGRIGLVSSFSLTQPDAPTGDQFSSGGGVAASVSAGVQVENSYVP